MENTENLSSDETGAGQGTDNSEKKGKNSLDQKGSSEYYQGERTIEDITLPGEKKSIKAETVPKEEIYEDKIKKQKDFIASLGRKKEADEKSREDLPEYVEKKAAPGRKIFFSFLAIIILGGLIGGGYWFWAGKKKETASKETQDSTIIPVNSEPEQAVSEEEQPIMEAEKVVLVDPAKIKVRVLNEGAASGSAGKIKTLLVGKGYKKAEADNGGLDSTGAFVYYSGQAAAQDAEAVSKILSDNGTSAKTREALISEQKSADIVVILGK